MTARSDNENEDGTATAEYKAQVLEMVRGDHDHDLIKELEALTDPGFEAVYQPYYREAWGDALRTVIAERGV